MTSLLHTAGIRRRDAAHTLASTLDRGHRPVTLLFRDTFGVELRLGSVDRTGRRGLDLREASYLDLPAGKPCRWRIARLTTEDGELAAGAFLLWIPGLLPAETNGALDLGGEPAGTILARLPGGMIRERTEALASDFLDEITGQDAAVKSRAALVTRAGVIGYAEEHWMTAFTESLA